MNGIESEQGFRCPACGAQTRVKETRRLHDGGLRRRRICPACRLKMTTAEMLVAQDWSKGVRSKGPMVAVRRKDLQRIVELATSAFTDADLHATHARDEVLATSPDAKPETP